MANDQAPPDDGDDLFNFDDLIRDSASPAAPHAAAAPVAPVSTAAGTPAPATASAPSGSSAQAAPAPVTPPNAAPQEKPAAPAVAKPVARVTTAAAQAQVAAVKAVVAKPPETAPTREVPVPRPRSNRWTLIAFAAATAVNLALVGVVWKSMSGVGDALRNVGENVARAQDGGEPRASAWSQITLEAPKADEGELALETAAAEIERGEYERARVRLYSLLSVLDRFDVDLRPNLAARAQVLAADSYRVQADAAEREMLEVSSRAGFVATPSEEHR